MTVFERFAAVAEANPAALAYTAGAVAITYSELADAVRSVRARILSCGPPEAAFVAILTSNRVNALAGILGAAGSGHAYVLLDVDDPDKRLAHILGEVEPFAILADQALIPRATALLAKGEVIDLDDPGSPDDPGLNGPSISPDSLLYVSFTSGSTGAPKGVCQTHRNLDFYAQAFIDTMEIAAGDKISWLFAHGASASNMDIYGALFTGAQLCAFEIKDQSFTAMARWIDEQQIVLLHTVPTVVRELVGAIEAEKVFRSVRVIDLAGEMLFPADVARMRPHFRGDCRILNRLAATEASFISSLVVTRAHEQIEGPLPVGKPPKGLEVSVVRADGSQAKVGETGSIAIDSPHICVGYFRRADLDAEAFSNVEGRPGWRRYKSADLGFIDKAGNLNFIGRSSSRIKLRGQAVDLAEVEAALYECAGVTGAVVLPRSESGGEALEILAYLTVAAEAPQEVGQIRKQLSHSLPKHALPSGYVFLDKFPYTATSKVDRNALAALDLECVRFRPGYVPPQNELEEKVAGIFSEVLEVPSVGRLDDFFLLGGDSLSLVNLQILATETFGRQLSQLNEDGTVKGVAEWLRELDLDHEIYAPILLPIRTEGAAVPLFVVHGRRGQAHVGPHFLRLLGDDQPLYALQARGLDDKLAPHKTVEAMAREYVAAIKAVQPEGPYFIGGFCAGSFVALEMIRLLVRQGDKYYRPLLIDPPVPNFKGATERFKEEFLLEQMERRVVTGDWKVDLHNTRAVKAAIEVARAFEEALEAYNPGPLPVHSMIIATLERWESPDKIAKVFGKRVDLFLIEGEHQEMFSPANGQFAAAVRKCVSRVRTIDEVYRLKTAEGRALKESPAQAERAPERDPV